MKNILIILMVLASIAYMFVLMYEKFERVSQEQDNRLKQEQRR